tara:strand:+ start:1618 stop:2265 length:648 start_codon:yes stop_codon:yes gene_type:complete
MIFLRIIKQHIGKNISVPDKKNGNNVKGLILGIRTLYLQDLGEYFFYEVLFQPDKEDSQAVVKLIYTEKYGIKVLGLETHADMMAKIEKENADMAASVKSIQMKILEQVAQQKNKPLPHRRLFGKKQKPESVSGNYFPQVFGHDYAQRMPQIDISSIVDQPNFAGPSSLSRTSSRSSSLKPRSSSPKRLTRALSFPLRKGGKKQKKAKKTKKQKK